jgi:hypothetical protein
MRYAAVLLITGGMACSERSPVGNYNKKRCIGDLAPSWTDLEGVDGQTHALADLKDKDVILVVFTTNHCPVAIAHEDRIIGFTKKYAGVDSKVATGYTGTVHFSSSDKHALLPANYTFTAASAGSHTFTATLVTAGKQWIQAADTVTTSLVAREAYILVQAAAASQVVITAPKSVRHGTAFSVTVTLLDAYGNVATGYLGTIHFTSSDSSAVLPANYTFTATDAGVHTFSVTLNTAGTDTLTATDMQNSTLTGTDSSIQVTSAAGNGPSPEDMQDIGLEEGVTDLLAEREEAESAVELATGDE